MLRSSINGRFLRTLRHLNGDGQTATARRFKVSQSAVSKWESLETGMHRRHLEALRVYAVEACRRLLKQVGLEVSGPSAYDRQPPDLTAMDSIDSDE
jgi:transcriptional regulator with XRE-family HTH domain